jgi:hypothetical protein
VIKDGLLGFLGESLRLGETVGVLLMAIQAPLFTAHAFGGAESLGFFEMQAVGVWRWKGLGRLRRQGGSVAAGQAFESSKRGFCVCDRLNK